MSIWSELIVGGIKKVITGVPNLYLAGAAIVLLGGVFVGGKIWFHNKVEAEAQKVINAYIETKKKEDLELSAIIIADNAKIKFLLQTQQNVITKTVVVNHTVIVTKVPDTNTILSAGWINTFNASVKGVTVDDTAASDATPSGVNAVAALDAVNTNNGICQNNLALLDAAQQFLRDQQAAVAAENKKHGVK